MKSKGIRFAGAALLCATSLSLVGLIGSAGRVVSAQAISDSYAIRNARIVTVTGPVIDNGTVVIANGKIAAIGVNPSVPSGAKVVDGKGLSVYPGMMDADT